MTTAEAAMAYCKQGWSVIPIRYEGTVEDKKKPLLPVWEPYQKKAASETQIQTWWTQWPKANVGLVMGSVSGLVALDLDGPHAMELIQQAKVHLPETATVQTSRGYHAIFRHPGYAIGNRVKLLSGGDSAVDVRGDGGYCFTAGHKVVRKGRWKHGKGHSSLVAIEKIKKGDILLAYDEEAGLFTETTVRSVSNRIVRETVILKFGTGGGAIRLTPEHPIMTTQGWKNAGDICIGDELFHATPAQMKIPLPQYQAPKGSHPPSARDYKKNPYRQKIPSHRTGMSGYERFVLSVAQSADIPLRYVGDGSLVIRSEGFSIQPDFIIDGTNKLVEVSISWHKHGLDGAPKTALREMSMNDRADLLKKAGYEVLYIDATEWGNGYNERTLVLIEKLRAEMIAYAGNGIKVIFAHWVIEPVEVFNLHCDSVHNYFVRPTGRGGRYILAHNCVAPPSVHGSGFQYRWVIPAERIAPLPDGVAALLSRQAKREEVEDSSWFEAAWRGVGDGQRNDTAARLAGYWLHVTKGSEEATYRAMTQWAERCTPPMALHELKTTIKSVARREAAKQTHEQTKTFTRHQVIEGPEWAEQMRTYRDQSGTPVRRVPGFDLLGGLVPGRLLLLAGRPGAGKSTFACQLSVEACLKSDEHVPTWVISTEMTLHEWGLWMAAYLNNSGTHSLPHPLPESLLQWWKISPIAITDSGTISIQDIRRMAEGRIGLKLLIVDHATRIVGGRKESRTLEVGDVARGLKSIAKDVKCTVLSLVQMNRRVEGADNARPRLSDLRDSGELESEADVVMFLWSKLKGEARYTAKVDTVLTVEKNRHGKTGDIPLVFDRVGRKLTVKE